MKKRIISWILAVMLVVTMAPINVSAEEAGEGNSTTWDGTSVDITWYNDTDKSFTINTAAGLAGLAQLVNSGNNFSGKTVTLGANIDLNNQQWTPIGGSGKAFLGTFDGGEKTISNLKIDSNASYVGLIGNAYGCKEIKNVKINNADIKGVSYIGTVSGNIVGKITNCHVSGSIKIKATNRYVGGITGWGYGTIDGCTVVASPNAGSIDGIYAGGIIGFLCEGNNQVLNCKVEKVNFNGIAGIGGIAGMAHYGSTVKDSSVKEVSIQTNYNSTDFTGLVVGQNGSDSTSSTTYVINNEVENVTAADGDTPITQLAAPTDNTVIGTGVKLDSNNKILEGTFEVKPPEAQLADNRGITTDTNGNFTIIVKEELTPDTTVQTKTYNGKPQAFELEGGYTITYKQGENAVPEPVNAGTYDVVISKEESDTTASYNETITGGLVIEKAELTASYVSEKILLNETPKFEIIVKGFVNDETAETANGYQVPVISEEDKKAIDNTKVNSYTLEPKDGAATNYEFVYVAGTLDILEEIVEYEIIQGAEQTVVQGNAAKFTSDAEAELFQRLMIDGEEVSSEHYKVEAGSTIVTLNADYVSTLSVGEHTLTIVSQDGEASTTFTVKAKDTTGGNTGTGDNGAGNGGSANTGDNKGNSSTNKGNVSATTPKTGDHTPILWMVMLMAVSACVAVVTVYAKKTNRRR